MANTRNWRSRMKDLLRQGRSGRALQWQHLRMSLHKGLLRCESVSQCESNDLKWVKNIAGPEGSVELAHHACAENIENAERVNDDISLHVSADGQYRRNHRALTIWTQEAFWSRDQTLVNAFSTPGIAATKRDEGVWNAIRLRLESSGGDP